MPKSIRYHLGYSLLLFSVINTFTYVRYLNEDFVIKFILFSGALIGSLILWLGYYKGNQKGHPIFLKIISGFSLMSTSFIISIFLGGGTIIIGVLAALIFILKGFKKSVDSMKNDALNGRSVNYFND